MGQGANTTLSNLFNPASGRDASHPYLISTWPKEMCTIMCVMCSSGRGMPFGVTNPCGRSKSQKLPPKVDNTFDGHYPQKRLFVGEDPPVVCLFTLAAKDTHDFALCKRREQFLRLTPISKKDVPHSCLISLS